MSEFPNVGGQACWGAGAAGTVVPFSMAAWAAARQASIAGQSAASFQTSACIGCRWSAAPAVFVDPVGRRLTEQPNTGARRPCWLRGVSAVLFAAGPVKEVVEDLLGQAPFVARQTKAHAPVRPLDHPAVSDIALFFAQGVRRLPHSLGIRHAVSSITNYDGQSLAYGCRERMGSVNPVGESMHARAPIGGAKPISERAQRHRSRMRAK